MLRDIRIAVRSCARRPAFSAGIVTILALGIGVNVLVFDMAWRLLYKPLPYARPDRLVRVWSQSPDGRTARLAFSIPRFEYFRDGQRALSAAAGDVAVALTLTGFGDPIQVAGRRVTANYFEVLGVTPLLGRGFRADEEQRGGVAVITERFWRERLGGAPDVVGRSLALGGTLHAIVGVVPTLPAADLADTDVFITRPYDIGLPREVLERGVSFLRFTGRLSDPATVDQAGAEMRVLAASYGRANSDKADATWQPRVQPIREDLSESFRIAMVILLAAVGMVLLLACSNVASLLTSHFLSRTRELAVRTALGARRLTVLRQCLVESMVLSTAGAAAGVALAVGLGEVLPALGVNLPIDATSGMRWSLLASGAVLALGAGLLTSVYPCVRATRTQALDALRGSRGSVGGRRRLQEVLVGVQVAISLVLMVAAGLLAESFARVSRQPPGFDPSRVLTATVTLPPRAYRTSEEQDRFYERLRERLEDAPDVDSAALIAGLPLSNVLSRAPYARGDRAIPLNERPLGPTRSVSPGYFSTMRIPILAGRDFDRRDEADAAPVMILSASAARRLFPDEDPIGRTVLTGSAGGGIRAEVVGIVGDVRSLSLTELTEVEIYRPYAQRTLAFGQLVVRGRSQASIAGTVRNTVQSLDPELPLTQVRTADEVVGESLRDRRMMMLLLTAFASLAFTLSAVGIYAVLAAAVGHRRTEIGVRMALGARAADVLRLLVGQGLRPVVFGSAAGLLALPAASSLLSRQLFEVSALDPRVLTLVTAAILVVASIAVLIPARRAAATDPALPLRGSNGV